MSPESLARTLEEYLSESREAVVVEEGAVVFDLAEARYSVATGHGKCVLHLWSAERNVVRRVMDAESKDGVLRLLVQRFGRARPSWLDISRVRDRRTPSARKAARAAYQEKLKRVIGRQYPEWRLERFTTAMDLERSFGPIYTRGLMRRGGSAFAVLGVNAQEMQASVDAALTFGILWLDVCRERSADRPYVEGLKLFVPAGKSAIVRERMAHLNRQAAAWQLFEFNEREETLAEVDTADRGNVATRLVRCLHRQAVEERFAKSVALVRSLLAEVEVRATSAAEVSFRWRGLEFARARMGMFGESFRASEEIVFGVGPAEMTLTEENAEEFAAMVERLTAERRVGGSRAQALWRIAPERWLESLVMRDVAALDGRLDAAHVYSQVPAFAASDRAMIDVLTVTRDGRLAVVELKADEDIHLPLQGLDYWARVSWHHQRGEFQSLGYFADCQLRPDPPLLLLVAPALHVHPATDTLLRYVAPEIEWKLVAVDEHWREGVRVVFRKHSASRAAVA